MIDHLQQLPQHCAYLQPSNCKVHSLQQDLSHYTGTTAQSLMSEHLQQTHDTAPPPQPIVLHLQHQQKKPHTTDTAVPTCPSHSNPTPTLSVPTDSSTTRPTTIHPFFTMNSRKRKHNPSSNPGLQDPGSPPPKRRLANHDSADESAPSHRTDGRPASPVSPVPAIFTSVHVHLFSSDVSPTHEGPPLYHMTLCL